MSYVTKSSLIAMLSDPAKRPHVIGRALVVLLDRQTDSEKATLSTKVTNNRGFTHADAYWGTIVAKSYRKTGTLSEKAVAAWMKLDSKGTPKIAKYWNQLDQAAAEKAAKLASRQVRDLTPSEKALGEPIAADTNPTDVIPSPRSVTVTYDLNDLRDALRYAEGK